MRYDSMELCTLQKVQSVFSGVKQVPFLQYVIVSDGKEIMLFVQ